MVLWNNDHITHRMTISLYNMAARKDVWYAEWRAKGRLL